MTLAKMRQKLPPPILPISSGAKALFQHLAGDCVEKSTVLVRPDLVGVGEQRQDAVRSVSCTDADMVDAYSVHHVLNRYDIFPDRGGHAKPYADNAARLRDGARTVFVDQTPLHIRRDSVCRLRLPSLYGR